MIDYFLYSISEGRRHGRVCALSHNLVGVSVWSLPLPPVEAEQKASRKQDFMRKSIGEEAAQIYLEICNNMSGRTARVTKPSDWYLSIAGVLPEHQGKGLGQQLIRPVLQEADAAGVASYLETFTARNTPFYERLGYKPLASFEEPVTGATYWVMRRAPGE
ncbi:MAG: GNAT family N-acetyltransferase [Pseudomonadota bacterium]